MHPSITAYRRTAAVAIAAALAGCGGEARDAKIEPPRPVVEVVAVAPAQAPGDVRASGPILYLREPELSFKATGVIARIVVDEGDRVRRGQRLAWLRPTEVEAGAAEADAALETAERALARAQTLFDKGLIAQARLDDALLQVDRARAAADAAGFTRDTAIITAPADGVILRRLAEPAQVIAAGAPVLSLGETGAGMIVRAAVSSAEAAGLKTGAPAQVRVNGRAYEAKIARLSAKGDGVTGAFDVDAAIAQPEGLRSGMVAEAIFRGDAQANSQAAPLRAPTLALLDARADQGVVFVLGADDRVSRRAVRTGGVIGEEVVILEGLAAGEKIVAAGAAYLSDGAAVQIAARP